MCVSRGTLSQVGVKLKTHFHAPTQLECQPRRRLIISGGRCPQDEDGTGTGTGWRMAGWRMGVCSPTFRAKGGVELGAVNG